MKADYHEAFLQTALKNNKAGKIGEAAAGIVESISSVCDKIGFAKDMIYVLYYNDKEKFDSCIKEIKKSCDHMSAYRIDSLVKQIKEEI